MTKDRELRKALDHPDFSNPHRSPTVEPPDAHAVDRWEWERALKRHAREAEMKAPVQHIALLLATYADARTGAEIRPGRDRLVAVSGRGKDTVTDALRWLREHGWLRLVHQGSGATSTTNEYQLTVPRVWSQGHHQTK